MIIYQDRPDNLHYNARTGWMDNHGGPGRMISYIGGVLYALDHERGEKIDYPVSRWKLLEIGLGCILAACGRKDR
jgi:hypothetical protein